MEIFRSNGRLALGVYQYNLAKRIRCTVIDSSFIMPIDIETRDFLVEQFQMHKNATYFNNKVVRLEGIETQNNITDIKLSIVDFYDFLVINIMLPQIKSFCKYLQQNEQWNLVEKSIEVLMDYSVKMKEKKSFLDIISDGKSTNSLAVSLLLKDEMGKYLLTQRSSSTGISDRLYSVTVTGAIDEEDLRSQNPIISCVKRELEEELGIVISSNNLDVDSIVIGINKMQPIVIVNGKIDGNIEDAICSMNEAKDYSYEIDHLMIVTKEQIRNILNKQSFTEAVKFHLESVL